MKTINSTIARAIYETCEAIDRKRDRLNDYEYEDAPYCGHFHSGHDGPLTKSRFHEGDGEAWTRNIMGWRAAYNTEEGYFMIWEPGWAIRRAFNTLKSVRVFRNDGRRVQGRYFTVKFTHYGGHPRWRTNTRFYDVRREGWRLRLSQY